MSERFEEEFTGEDGRTARAACAETETEWVLYGRERFVTGEVIRRKRDGAKAIVSDRTEETPEGAGIRMGRQWARRIMGK